MAVPRCAVPSHGEGRAAWSLRPLAHHPAESHPRERQSHKGQPNLVARRHRASLLEWAAARLGPSDGSALP